MGQTKSAGLQTTFLLHGLRRQPAQRSERAAETPTLFAAALIGLITIARLAYLLCDCPLDLSPDEGHYWDWSRHLDWSYYSKGPIVAWLIAGSCALFGDVSQALTGTLMPAVRLPAVLCGAVTLWGCFVLARRVHGKPWLALGVVVAAITLPVLTAGSLLMTIDGPYVACWTWALVVAQGIVAAPAQGDVPRWRWMLLGGIVAVGILTKYTMVLFLPSLALYFLVRAYAAPGSRNRFAKRLLGAIPAGFWLACAMALLGCFPIVIWNAQHGWVTVLHVARQAGVQGAPTWHWLGPLDYCAGQFGLLLGFWFVPFAVMLLAVPWKLLRQRTDRPARDEQFLWCMAAPMFVTFLAFSVRTKVELNWPVTAYVSGLVLAAGFIVRQCNSSVRWWRSVARLNVAFPLVLGLAITVLMHHVEWLYPWFPQGTSVRRWDPTCRLRGWQELARAVESEREALRARGPEPLVAASGWALPGNLAVHLSDHPQVYSFARANGGRHSQYDFWLPNPVSNPDQFRGQTFVYVGELSPLVSIAFEKVDASRWVVHEEQGREVARWQLTTCYGFKGFREVGSGGY